MSDTTVYRCYYDDGTILTDASFCPNFNSNGAGLVTSELTIIEDVIGQRIGWQWILLVLGLIVLATKERK